MQEFLEESSLESKQEKVYLKLTLFLYVNKIY